MNYWLVNLIWCPKKVKCSRVQEQCHPSACTHILAICNLCINSAYYTVCICTYFEHVQSENLYAQTQINIENKLISSTPTPQSLRSDSPTQLITISCCLGTQRSAGDMRKQNWSFEYFKNMLNFFLAMNHEE